MEFEDHIKVSETCFDSYTSQTSEELKAYFKSTKDLHFDDMPADYVNYSMTRIQGRQYLIDANYGRMYCVDLDTLKAETHKLNIYNITNCFFQERYILVIRFFKPMVILRDLKEIGQIEFKANYECCKNGHFIVGRYAQQVSQTV